MAWRSLRVSLEIAASLKGFLNLWLTLDRYLVLAQNERNGDGDEDDEDGEV